MENKIINCIESETTDPLYESVKNELGNINIVKRKSLIRLLLTHSTVNELEAMLHEGFNELAQNCIKEELSKRYSEDLIYER